LAAPLAGGKRLLRPDGILFLYGPFIVAGRHTATTNVTFDADLKQRDPRWDVRDVDDIVREATPNGLALRDVVEMLANNNTESKKSYWKRGRAGL
jgi:hypothetical protein